MDQQDIQNQIDAFRTKLDELKVQGHLLKMEHRDKQDEVVNGIETAWFEAKEKFEAMKAAGETEATQLGEGFNAAWAAFKQAYNNAAEEGAE